MSFSHQVRQFTLYRTPADHCCEPSNMLVAWVRCNRWKVSVSLSDGNHAILVAGGVSMGNKDFIKGILERKGEVHFGRVRDSSIPPLLHLMPRLCCHAPRVWCLSCACAAAGEDEAWEAAHIRDYRCQWQQESHDSVWAARQPSQQHSHLQPRVPACTTEAVGPSGTDTAQAVCVVMTALSPHSCCATAARCDEL